MRFWRWLRYHNARDRKSDTQTKLPLYEGVDQYKEREKDGPEDRMSKPSNG